MGFFNHGVVQKAREKCGWVGLRGASEAGGSAVGALGGAGYGGHGVAGRERVKGAWGVPMVVGDGRGHWAVRSSFTLLLQTTAWSQRPASPHGAAGKRPDPGGHSGKSEGAPRRPRSARREGREERLQL